MAEVELNNNGTSKHHKMDEKVLILRCVFLHQFYPPPKPPLHQAPIQKLSGLFNLISLPMLTEKLASPFCQFFWFWFQPKNIFIFM